MKALEDKTMRWNLFVTSFVVALGITASTQSASAHLHPAQGRFMQRDPLAHREGPNFHEYVRGQPVRFGDPSGKALHVKVVPPSIESMPWTAEPMQDPDNLGETSQRNRVENCCIQKIEGWELESYVTLLIKVVLNTDELFLDPWLYAGPDEVSWEGTYGHEQRHAQNTVEWSEFCLSVANYKQFHDSPVACHQSGIRFSFLYRSCMDQISVIDDHSGQYFEDPVPSWRFYPPIGVMPSSPSPPPF